MILLTSSELSEIRDLLKQSLVNPAGKDLYVSLYASWCHSPMAIISLCLLAQVGIYKLVLIITGSMFNSRTCALRHTNTYFYLKSVFVHNGLALFGLCVPSSIT